MVQYLQCFVSAYGRIAKNAGGDVSNSQYVFKKLCLLIIYSLDDNFFLFIQLYSNCLHPTLSTVTVHCVVTSIVIRQKSISSSSITPFFSHTIFHLTLFVTFRRLSSSPRFFFPMTTSTKRKTHSTKSEMNMPEVISTSSKRSHSPSEATMVDRHIRSAATLKSLDPSVSSPLTHVVEPP